MKLNRLRVKKDRGGYRCYGLWFKKKSDAKKYKSALIKQEMAERKGMKRR